MKKFIINTGMFTILVVLTIIGVFYQADGETDPFYDRFTTNKQTSLILGTSRAAQGILPDILNSELNRNDIYNYSFTISHSPFGSIYLKSIKAKLDVGETDGIFIITVDPWSISSKTVDPNDFLNFREVDLSLGQVSFVNYHPNFEYLISFFGTQYIEILKGGSDELILHRNGWLEVTVEMDSINVAERLKSTLHSYENENLPIYNFSTYRYNYLGKTISYLKNYGKVYLVRLPISPGIFEIENKLISDFDLKMKNLSKEYKIPYFNLTNRNHKFLYTDGNHLYKESGEEVSLLISRLIQESSN